LYPVENLWKDLKIAVQCHPLSSSRACENLQGRMGENPQIQMYKLVQTYPRQLKSGIAAKGASALQSIDLGV
jgi:hypothetical protein